MSDVSDKSYFRYWGKADTKYQGEPKWHPLVYHCLDVAACCRILLEKRPDWLQSLSRFSGLSDSELIEWVTFLLAVHDCGKFGDGFQSQRKDLLRALQERDVHIAQDVRHDTLGYELLMNDLPQWLQRDDLGKCGGMFLRPWLAAVTGHHGRPPKNDGNSALLLRNHFPKPITSDIAQFMQAMAGLLLPKGCPLSSTDFELVGFFKQGSWLVAGLSVVADWIGSNTKWFPYRCPEKNLQDYWHEIALPQAKTAISESGLMGARGAEFGGFKALFESIEPTPLQTWAETISLAEGPQLFVLEELTGGGKTEAAITLAARLMATGLWCGMYIALPTMATADAMFDRLRKGNQYRRLFVDGRASLALAHSADRLKLALEEANRQDNGYGSSEEESASRQCSAWLSDNRKKALLADFGIGTIDQALLSVLSARHQSLRLLGLSSKILIVDEVHACDAYVGELLKRLLTFHAALGGSAILLSATLPFSQREQYVSAFAAGMGCSSPQLKEKYKYPLATHISKHTPPMETMVEARKEVSRKVQVIKIAEVDAAYSLLAEVAKNERCGVWVRNTIADAVTAWRKCKKDYPDYEIILYHARFALVDRLRIGKDIGKRFGPDSVYKDRYGKIVIATQVIEQSLDVDFDYMITDLAPIDLIIQRAGRLQRHIRDKQGNRIDVKGAKDQRGGPLLALLTPEPVDEAVANWYKCLLPKAAMVYKDHGRLWLTAKWLVGHGGFELPGQARDMIEYVYGAEGECKIPEKLLKATDKATGDKAADRSLAAFNALDVESGYEATGLHWQDDDNAPTRLGEATVRVRLARLRENSLIPWADTQTGMEWALSELSIPKRLIASESTRYAALIATAKASMPDEGRYCVVIPLDEISDEIWKGYAVNLDGDEVKVNYSKIAGLTIEKGVDDESDL